MRYSTEYLFPSLLHIIETDVDEQIKPYCLNVRQKDPVGNVLTNMGGWQSQSIYEDTLITDSLYKVCLLYTSPSTRDSTRARMPTSA